MESQCLENQLQALSAGVEAAQAYVTNKTLSSADVAIHDEKLRKAALSVSALLQKQVQRRAFANSTDLGYV